MRISAKVDYAVRACVELAQSFDQDAASPRTGEELGSAQQIPKKYLENILAELRRADIVRSQRGPVGGYWLASAPHTITIADVIRAVVDAARGTGREVATAAETRQILRI